MKKTQSLSFEESLKKIDELKVELCIENQERLNEILGIIPEKLDKKNKELVIKYTNIFIRQIICFKKMYRRNSEKVELNSVIREVIISFRYDVKYSLDKK